MIKKFQNKNLKLIKKYTQNKSTQKVIKFIESLLKNNQKKIVCIIQARTGSTRLPSKVLLDLEGKPVLLRVIDRILQSKIIDQIVIATTKKIGDRRIVDLVGNYHPRVDIFLGSEDNVLDRYYQAAKKFKAKIIVRITSDCPLIDPEVVDKVISAFLREKETDYAANVLGQRTYPRGLDVEVFSLAALKKMWQNAKNKDDREHVTLYLRKRPQLFKCKNVANDIDYSYHRWTLDEKADCKLIRIIYQKLYLKNPNFRMKDIIKLFEKNPKLIKINQYVEQKLSKF